MTQLHRNAAYQKRGAGFVEETCIHCDGCGLVNNKLCKVCNGHGVITVNDYGEQYYAPTDEQKRASMILGGRG